MVDIFILFQAPPVVPLLPACLPAADFCDEDVAACYCPSNTTYGRIPAPRHAPQGRRRLLPCRQLWSCIWQGWRPPTTCSTQLLLAMPGCSEPTSLAAATHCCPTRLVPCLACLLACLLRCRQRSSAERPANEWLVPAQQDAERAAHPLGNHQSRGSLRPAGLVQCSRAQGPVRMLHRRWVGSGGGWGLRVAVVVVWWGRGLLMPAATAAAAAALAYVEAIVACKSCLPAGWGGRNCEERYEMFCFNQCNGRGECQGGYCKCDPGGGRRQASEVRERQASGQPVLRAGRPPAVQLTCGCCCCCDVGAVQAGTA